MIMRNQKITDESQKSAHYRELLKERIIELKKEWSSPNENQKRYILNLIIQSETIQNF